jgi:hypothetical protein
MNNMVGDVGVSERLDMFLVLETLMMEDKKIRRWVKVGGGSDHSPIILQIDRMIQRKHPLSCLTLSGQMMNNV